ncbi:MAG: hypothetical protein WBW41_10380, partial [Verrucomicrobiia bacterium]
GRGQVSTWTFWKMRSLPFSDLRHEEHEKKWKPLRIHEISASPSNRRNPERLVENVRANTDLLNAFLKRKA